MSKKPDAPAQLQLSAVSEEFAAMADFFRQRSLLRASEVDQLRRELAARESDAAPPAPAKDEN
ncbi:MAG TPA: hypothetical protein VGN80_19055 [Devosiaceae bacterium]|jgi:hypothetical protein|nr:hypothetical protein [Devosiaceae bacterium]